MKKFVSLAVAAVMLATACASLAACGQIYEAGEDLIDWDVDLSQPIKLRGYFPETALPKFGEDDTAKIIERETGYVVEYSEQKGSNMEGQVSNILQNPNDTKNHYNFLKLNDGCYTPYLENEIFLDLTRLLKETPEGKVLYQLVDMMDNGWESVIYTDSEGEEHIYAIPDFGYVHMTDSALVWNMGHLKLIGFEEEFGHELPETLSEATWAFRHLQEQFKNVSGYHALGVPGAASAEVNPIAGCFEVPYNFYVDEDGKIQIKNKSQNMYDYAEYMNMLYREGILSSSWNSSSDILVAQNFGNQLHSCAYMTYWRLTSFVNTVKDLKKVAATYREAYGLPADSTWNTVNNIHDTVIRWTNRLRGDSFTFETADKREVSCKEQTTSKLPGNAGGVSYYTVIPAFMAKDARYVIDYLAKKMEAFADFFGGNGILLEDQAQYNGKFPADTHWYEIETPEGAPAPEDYPADDLPYEERERLDAEYTAHEDFKQNICFVRPMKYSYVDTRLKANGGHAGHRGAHLLPLARDRLQRVVLLQLLHR